MISVDLEWNYTGYDIWSHVIPGGKRMPDQICDVIKAWLQTKDRNVLSDWFPQHATSETICQAEVAPCHFIVEIKPELWWRLHKNAKSINANCNNFFFNHLCVAVNRARIVVISQEFGSDLCMMPMDLSTKWKSKSLFSAPYIFLPITNTDLNNNK